MSRTGRPKVLFYVQHLLGIGHLKRAATLTRAIQAAGLDVTLVSGGETVPGVDIGDANLVQLPAVRAADKYFKVLVDQHGHEIDDRFRGDRRRRLLATFNRLQPDAVVTELFPFGRRQLRFELIPLLEAAVSAVPRPSILCSVRDILVDPPKPERIAEMLELVERYYDRILVHGDPTLISFDETFSPARRLGTKLTYTGYVVDVPRARDPNGPGAGEVIVSAGGGAVSEALFRTAAAARHRSRLGTAVWRILAGHALPETTFQAVRDDAPDGIVVERARSDFATLLANCALSISQGGYNTVMEVMAARARGIIVPYAGGLETEQTLRARLLSRTGGLHIIAEHELSPDRLADGVDSTLDGPPADAGALDTDGAERTANLLRQLAPAGAIG